jgi:hypothetical protein
MLLDWLTWVNYWISRLSPINEGGQGREHHQATKQFYRCGEMENVEQANSLGSLMNRYTGCHFSTS